MADGTTIDLATFAAAMDSDTRAVVMELASFDDFPIPYIRDLASDLGIPVERVRRVLIALQKDGFTAYGQVFSPDGLCVGSTYWLTYLGERLREAAGSVIA